MLLDTGFNVSVDLSADPAWLVYVITHRTIIDLVRKLLQDSVAGLSVTVFSYRFRQFT